MSMFNYKDYSTSESSELAITSHKLAVYSSLTGVMGLPTEKVLQALGDVASNTGIYPSKIDLGLPSGWREITPSELHLPDDALDFSGYYHIDSPLTGKFPTGPQAKVLGEFDASGNLQRVSVSYAGTNSPIDVIDYFQMNEGTIAPNMEPLLNAVKGYAIENQLNGENVLITGYSLGGGMTNIMARFKDTLSGGFFKDSAYVGHAAPTILDTPDILNIGYENDAVYRITGNEANVHDAIKAGKPGLVNPDSMFGSTVDNIILYNDVYASPIWNISPLSMSILNIPIGWFGHIDGTTTDAISRIIHSTFYEYTQRDSTVIVDNLSAITRPFTWVEDKVSPTSDHHGTPAFIIGNDYNNLLKGGDAGDYIDAAKGDDKIQTGFGADRIDGGEGVDTLILEGHQQDWDIYKMHDGTLFFNAHNGSGLKEVQNVEQVSFENDILSNINQYTISESGLQDHRFKLFTWLNHDKAYDSATEGSALDDSLEGKVVFARAGNDVLTADTSGSLLHGGEGQDYLYGKEGNDTLFGAEGDDVLSAMAGNNTLYGGIGKDTFVFAQNNSHNVIKDFNQYANDSDVLQFSKQVFADKASVAHAAHQEGNHVLIQHDQFYLQIQSSSLEDVMQAVNIMA